MIGAHIEAIQIVSKGLEDLLDEVVFIGGAVAELYATRAGSGDIRVTLDVDCVIEISSLKEYHALERIIESKGFQHDNSPGAPICRWNYKGIAIDIMPTHEEVLGFSNSWYIQGIKHKVSFELPDGTIIFIFTPDLYLASKIEAFKQRGGKDLRQSHDFEDIIFLLENNIEITAHILASGSQVKMYLAQEFKHLLSRKDLEEGVESALPYGSDSDGVEKILELMETVAGLV